MQPQAKLNVRPWIVVAAVFGLTMIALVWALKTPARAAAHPSFQATATAAFTATITPTLAAGQSVNACGVVMSGNFVTPTVTVTATTIAADATPTVVVSPTETVSATETISPTATVTSTDTISSTETISPTEMISPTGKVLRIGEDVYPAELDPQRVSFVNEFEIVELAYEGLTTVDPSGKIQPGAASSFAFTPDQKQLTFTIRDGLKRVDGTPITAKDFKAAAMRALDPCLGGRQYAALLYDIQGAQASANLKRIPTPLPT